jgi:hypothetical protein
MQQKIQELEQLTQELKARLLALENAQPANPQPPSPGIATKVTLTTASPAEIKQPKSSSASAITANEQPGAQEQKAEEKKPQMDIYGFAMLDTGYDFGQNDPDWFDVVRPTKLPAFANEFGDNGRYYTGVRQTRFGVKNTFPTRLGELKTNFEFEMFGVGQQAGQTNFRLRQAYGELGQFLAGQTWSPFMDPDVYPNSIEYWGPNGMVFFRNVQFRWQPINKGNKQIYIALEKPGSTADLGTVAQRDELQGVQFRFPAPDVTGRIRYGGQRSHLQLAAIMRYIAWDDLNKTPTLNLSGHTWGWGVHASSVVGVGKKDAVKMSIVYGHGMENYMNDAPVDIATKATTNPIMPFTGDALPVLGVLAFYDHYWNERVSSSVGYSLVNIYNVALQLPNAFHRGQYGLFNVLFYPTKNTMAGGEFIWGQRNNFSDGFVFDDYRIQFSFKYNFDIKLLGGPK